MFSSFLLVLDFVVDFGRGLIALWQEFGVHELFSGSGVAGVVLRLRRRRGEGGNGAERRRQLCVISIDICVPAGGGLRLLLFLDGLDLEENTVHIKTVRSKKEAPRSLLPSLQAVEKLRARR